MLPQELLKVFLQNLVGSFQKYVQGVCDFIGTQELFRFTVPIASDFQLLQHTLQVFCGTFENKFAVRKHLTCFGSGEVDHLQLYRRSQARTLRDQISQVQQTSS